MDNKRFRFAGGSGNAGRGNKWKNAGFIALIILFGLIIWSAFNQPSTLKTVPFSQVISDANSGKVQQITVSNDNLEITLKGQEKPTEKSAKEPGSSIYEQWLQQGKVVLINKPTSSGANGFCGQLAIGILPV